MMVIEAPLVAPVWLSRPLHHLSSFVRTIIPSISPPTSAGAGSRTYSNEDWTTPTRVLLKSDIAPAALLAELREVSGITWAELASLVGVSARTLHYWANGGAIAATHRARLSEVTGFAEQMHSADRQYVAEALRSRFRPAAFTDRSAAFRPSDLMSSVADDAQHGVNPGVELLEF